MKIGVHVSAAGGLVNAPLNAKTLGCETFQFFSRSPRGGKPTPLTKSTVKEFKQRCMEYGLVDYYIHTPYYINFASSNQRIRHGSIEVVRQELERGELLGVRATMTHLGSAKDLSPQPALKLVAQGIIEVLANYKGKNRLLLEISAGSGQVIGANFTELAELIKLIEQKIKHHQVGVCFDTAHAFASGYDLRNDAKVKQTLKKFDQIIGLNRLVLIHANDSKADFNSHKDRHENIGQGKIGRQGFAALVSYPKLKKVNFILETPWDNENIVKKDLHTLKKLRDKK